MTENEFIDNARCAEHWTRLSQPPENVIWEGYLQGLRRHYHGEAFGTANEHKLWLSLKDETADNAKRLRGVGYLMGFEGKSGSDVAHYISRVQPPILTCKRIPKIMR